MAISLSFLLLGCVLSCTRKNREDPQIAFDHANKALLHADLKQAQAEAHAECERFRLSDPKWAWKFRTLEARSALQQGLYDDALKILKSTPLPSDQPDLVVPILALEGDADVQTHNFPEAETLLNQAAKVCETSASASCGNVLKARGLLAVERNDLPSAEQLFELTLSFARSHGDALLESHALLNLGNTSLEQGHYDEAIDRSEAGYEAAKAAGARRLELITQGNIAWSYYKLGDYEKSLQLAGEAYQLALQLPDVWTAEEELINIGDIYMDEGKFKEAENSFQQSLHLAQGIDAKDDMYANLRVLARLSLLTGDLVNAGQYAQKAMEMAQKDKNHLNELYPTLTLGQVAASRGDTAAAETVFHAVEHDEICPVFLKWEAEHSLARLYENENRPEMADQAYRDAIATFEGARDIVQHQDSQLSFLTNGARIYDDYVHFLVAHDKSDDALRWADSSRARTLSEGLGLLPKGRFTSPPPLNAQQIAQRTEGTVLFYWLGEKQSFLWAITPQKASLFTLPPGSEIDAAAERYSKSLIGPGEVLESADPDGQWLYRTLIEPAQSLLKRDARIFIIPDGKLNNLNFETLLVPEPKPAAPAPTKLAASSANLHYWIEDATITNASSLRMLGASQLNKSAEKHKRRLLLVGNSVAPNDIYSELPRSAAQMENVARHFLAANERVFAREQATPAAYLTSNPEQFSYIHFVAHGTSSRLSPLDSAIILSKTASSENKSSDSFKLYARDIVTHRPFLRADLVTISACYGVGERAYSGEGLVGLSWAFLGAGAHNVVAALWEVTDTSAEQLMDKFYDELGKGSRPDAALRAAKLSLLRNSKFRNPFYWAPFQLYTGSGDVSVRSSHLSRSPEVR